MTELNPPGFLQNRADHPARELRSAISGLIATPGIVSVGDWVVTQRGAGANMSVDIAGGSGYIAGTENVNQGFYHCVSDATIVNKAVGASSGTQARKDIVVARVYDQFYSGATNLWQFEVIAGTFGSGAEPAVPANSYKVATIDIAINAASIINANITPRTQQYSVNHVPVFVANQAARDALVLFDGLQVYRLDLHLVETYNSALALWFGGAWTAYAATLTASVTNPNLGTTGFIAAAYTKTGRTINWRFLAQTGGTGIAVGSGTYSVLLPVAPAASGGDTIVGSGWVYGVVGFKLFIADTQGTVGTRMIISATNAGLDHTSGMNSVGGVLTIGGSYESNT